MAILVFSILAVPLIAGLSVWFSKNSRIAGYLNMAGHLAVLAASVVLLKCASVAKFTWFFGDLFYIDALSVFFIFTIALVTFATSLYSIEYISGDVEKMVISERKAKVYYLLFNLFSVSMFLVVMVNNLAILWVAIEMTTLISAFLVGFYNTRASVEAAWKYLIICSVGIILSLLGTVLFAYALSLYSGLSSLNWTDLVSSARYFDKNVIKAAFIFILVGYGTKAGLAPLHTWLPDAHSQAVGPISALLSGVLLKTALYAILRYGIIMNRCFESNACFSNFMIVFGVCSLVIACGFILVQKDMKRLLAYSSIEHIGIISIGFGIGGTWGIFGALFHILNHAMTKSFMFFGVANIVSVYKKHSMDRIRGVLSSMPFTGTMILIGVFALSGFPPFSMFVSELLIVFAAFGKQSYFVALLLLFLLAVAFGAMLYHFGRSLFGKPPHSMVVVKEPVVSKAVFLFALFFISVLGIAAPWLLRNVFVSATDILIKGI